MTTPDRAAVEPFPPAPAAPAPAPQTPRGGGPDPVEQLRAAAVQLLCAHHFPTADGTLACWHCGAAWDARGRVPRELRAPLAALLEGAADDFVEGTGCPTAQAALAVARAVLGKETQP